MSTDTPYQLQAFELNSNGVTVKEWSYHPDSVVFHRRIYGHDFSNDDWIGEVEVRKVIRFYPNRMMVSIYPRRGKPSVSEIEIETDEDKIVIGDYHSGGVMHVRWDSSRYSIRYKYGMLVREFVVRYAANSFTEMAIIGTDYHEEGLATVADSVNRCYFEMVGPAGSFHQLEKRGYQIRRSEKLTSVFAEESGCCGIRIYTPFDDSEMFRVDGCGGTMLTVIGQNL
jgi:hypothetical protein